MENRYGSGSAVDKFTGKWAKRRLRERKTIDGSTANDRKPERQKNGRGRREEGQPLCKKVNDASMEEGCKNSSVG